MGDGLGETGDGFDEMGDGFAEMGDDFDDLGDDFGEMGFSFDEMGDEMGDDFGESESRSGQCEAALTVCGGRFRSNHRVADGNRAFLQARQREAEL